MLNQVSTSFYKYMRWTHCTYRNPVVYDLGLLTTYIAILIEIFQIVAFYSAFEVESLNKIRINRKAMFISGWNL